MSKLLGMTWANFRLQDNCQKNLLAIIFALTDNANNPQNDIMLKSTSFSAKDFDVNVDGKS